MFIYLTEVVSKGTQIVIVNTNKITTMYVVGNSTVLRVSEDDPIMVTETIEAILSMIN
jgi:hypothetical protein